jgi:predicted nucleic acid-binding protein
MGPNGEMSLLLDASVLVPLFVAEARSDAVECYLATTRPAIVISDFAIGEVTAALGAMVRRRSITREAADTALANLDIFVARSAKRAVTMPEDVHLASQLVRRHELALRMPDALYLALNLRLGLSLMTADVVLAEAAKVFGVEVAGPEF